MNNLTTLGWDVGGAHLKAVQIDASGKVLAASQVYCALWRGLKELDLAIDQVLNTFNATQALAIQHAVTMTGELADIFPNRHAGVMQIVTLLQQKLVGEIRYFVGEKGFISFEKVAENTTHIASMNWLASLQYLATYAQQALFIDIGSTTTDIALITEGKPFVLGFNDGARMQYDELVYTGVVRTPLMAIAQKIAFNGQLANVAAEHFATTADVYTLTGDLPLAENMAETADGAEKSEEASARRIARMIGWDAQDAPISAWRNLAYAFRSAQLQQIQQAVLRQISTLGDCRGVSVIGAGAGDFLVSKLAQQLGFRYVSIATFIDADNDKTRNMAALCFPAYAVARLASQC